ncbi:MAG: PadR family transcriptional regulator [Desulfomonile tiedjei]|uniref:PadR family transcriptional regulator n=1 Tax=Desulfomonile tiedjei TaxID=2358 RepID=A0A9D6V1G8_9BACT|nr:PadR family transcriptional regulator [Desulfomonile tiedjei]
MVDFDQCSCAGINLDKLIQPMILIFLAEQELHGYGLVQKIMNSPMLKGTKPDPTGVYRFLKSMEGKNLIISSWEFVDSGPPKKTYRITGEGMACMEKWITTLKIYVRSIDDLLNAADKILEASGVENSRYASETPADPSIKSANPIP